MPRYLDDVWFARVGQLLATRPPGAAFVVEHRVALAHATLKHTQTFSGADLVSWRSGGPLDPPDLVLRRTLELDAGDLLGRLDPQAVADETSYLLAEHPERAADVFGVGDRLVRDVVGVPASMRISLQVDVPDTAHGPACKRYELRGSALVSAETSGEAPAVEVTAPYRTVMGWLHHGELGLGPLVWDGSVTGDIARISALSGVVSCIDETDPAQQFESQMSLALLRYQQLRRLPDVVAVLDEIEAITEPC